VKKQNINELFCEELNRLFLREGFKACHAPKVFKALYRQRETDFSRISDVSQKLRHFLEDRFYISSVDGKERQKSQDGAEKFLFSLADGNTVESVYIPEPGRHTLCVSSQVGCKFGCTFCVSGRNGFVRHLSASEIVGQVLAVNKMIVPETISNVTFMGTGEPLDNYQNLMRAIHIMRDSQGLYMAKRKISISTCGIVPGIQKLSEEAKGVRLSVSLHSTDNTVRSSLMPINNTYPLEMLKESMQAFTRAEGMPVFLEYIMIQGLNISGADARSLVLFVQDLDCKINLIPYNPSPYCSWKSPDQAEIDAFRIILEESGVFYWLRKSRGRDISAACGLLHASIRP